MDALRNDTLGAQFLRNLETLKEDQDNNIDVPAADPDPIVETLESNLAKVEEQLENTPQDNNFVTLGRSDSKILKWVQSAISKDDARATLTGTYFHDNKMVCADGWRLNVTDIPKGLENIAGLKDTGKVRAGENILELSDIEGQFPDYDQIIPKGDPTIRIGVNPLFLMEVLKGLDKDAILIIDITTPSQPIALRSKIEGQDTLTVLMPMHISGGSEYYLKPKEETTEEATTETEQFIILSLGPRSSPRD